MELTKIVIQIVPFRQIWPHKLHNQLRQKITMSKKIVFQYQIMSQKYRYMHKHQY